MTARRGALSDLECFEEETGRLEPIDARVHGVTTEPGQGQVASPRTRNDFLCDVARHYLTEASSSTRRLCARPASVELSAAGFSLPCPSA